MSVDGSSNGAHEQRREDHQRAAGHQMDEDDAKPVVDIEVDVGVVTDERSQVRLTADDCLQHHRRLLEAYICLVVLFIIQAEALSDCCFHVPVTYLLTYLLSLLTK